MKTWTVVEFGLQEKSAKEIMQWVRETFGGYELVEHSQSKLKLRVPRTAEGRRITFADLFAFAEKAKEEGLVVDYAVCETTLEHIFQYFARQDLQEGNH